MFSFNHSRSFYFNLIIWFFRYVDALSFEMTDDNDSDISYDLKMILKLGRRLSVVLVSKDKKRVPK